MFGVASELGAVPRGSTFRGQLSRGFTYLPYPSFTVAVLSMIFDSRIEECAAFWADTPSPGKLICADSLDCFCKPAFLIAVIPEEQSFPEQVCAGIAVNTNAVGAVVGAACLASADLAHLFASIAELRTRFAPSQLLESVVSGRWDAVLSSQLTCDLLQDVLLLSLAIDCISRFHSPSLHVDKQSLVVFRTDVIAKVTANAMESIRSYALHFAYTVAEMLAT